MSRGSNTRQTVRGPGTSRSTVSSQASKSATSKPPTSTPMARQSSKASTNSKPTPAPLSSSSASSRPSSSTNATFTQLRPEPGAKESPLDGIARLRQLQAQNANKTTPALSGVLGGDMSRRSSLGTPAGGPTSGRISPVVPNPNSFIATNGYRPPAVPATTPNTNEPNVHGDLMDWFGDPNAQTVTSLSLMTHNRLFLTCRLASW